MPFTFCGSTRPQAKGTQEQGRDCTLFSVQNLEAVQNHFYKDHNYEEPQAQGESSLQQKCWSYWRTARMVGDSCERERAFFCDHQGSRAWSCKILGSLCSSHTWCVIRPGKRNMLAKPPRVQFASSFIVVLILCVAACVRAEESG